jgi:hypothetical protein
MKLLLVVTAFCAGLVVGAGHATAEVEYPWCIIAGGRDGSMSCGFVSFEQCLQTRIGTDMCVQNPRYQAPVSRAPRRPQRN